MPLEILLVLVVGGIAGITLLLHLSGKSRLRHFPGDAVVDVTISHDCHAALVRTADGPGLLWSFGADTVARRLIDYDWVEHPKGIQVYFHDFSTPSVLVRLDDIERRHWQHLMEPA